MIKSILATFFLLSGFDSFSQNTNPFATQKEVIEVINWKIKSDKANSEISKVKRINRQVVLWNSSDLDDLIPDTLFYKGLAVKMRRLDTVFSAGDFDYLKKQLTWQLGEKQTWGSRQIKGVKIINPKVNKILKLDQPYWEYSVPIFSSDHTLCILKYNYKCGLLCASWRTSLFRKTTAGWEEVIILYGIES